MNLIIIIVAVHTNRLPTRRSQRYLSYVIVTSFHGVVQNCEYKMASLEDQTTASDQMARRTMVMPGAILDPPTTSTSEPSTAIATSGVTLQQTPFPWLAG